MDIIFMKDDSLCLSGYQYTKQQDFIIRSLKNFYSSLHVHKERHALVYCITWFV